MDSSGSAQSRLGVGSQAHCCAEEADVSAVIVTYNSVDVLAACLQSVESQRDIDLRVQLVDNDSSDGTLAIARRYQGFVEVSRNRENLGFAAASNVGIAKGSGQYVLLLNPDTVVRDGALAELVRFLDEHPSAAMVAPRIVDESGQLKHSVRNRFPGLLSQIFEGLCLHRLLPVLSPYLGEVVTDSGFYARARSVAWACGAALLVRRSAIEDVGCLDEAFFLFGEEKDLCYRVREAGWKVYLCPTAEVVHRGSDYGKDARKLTLLATSLTIFYSKHYPSWKARTASCLALVFMSLRLYSCWLAWRLSGSTRGHGCLCAYSEGAAVFRRCITQR